MVTRPNTAMRTRQTTASKEGTKGVAQEEMAGLEATTDSTAVVHAVKPGGRGTDAATELGDRHTVTEPLSELEPTARQQRNWPASLET